jgi:threonine/homoserine/homoserine lactone efflux protein
MKKLMNLLNLKKWIETFLVKTVVNKGVKHAVTVIIGLVAGAKVQAILTQYGVQLDIPHLQAELTVMFGAAAGWLINWGLKVMDKDGSAQTETVKP